MFSAITRFKKENTVKPMVTLPAYPVILGVYHRRVFLQVPTSNDSMEGSTHCRFGNYLVRVFLSLAWDFNVTSVYLFKHCCQVLRLTRSDFCERSDQNQSWNTNSASDSLCGVVCFLSTAHTRKRNFNRGDSRQKGFWALTNLHSRSIQPYEYQKKGLLDNIVYLCTKDPDKMDT